MGRNVFAKGLRNSVALCKGYPGAALSVAFLLTLVVIAVLAPWLSPYDPSAQDHTKIFEPMSRDNLLGTDDLGRDVLSRLIYGARVQLYACFLAVAVGAAIGVPVGMLAGYFPGAIDDVISRIIDTFLSFPAIVLAIAVLSVLGIGLTNAMISVGIIMAPELARLTRAQVLVVRESLYVDAARCFGAKAGRILWKHILPNIAQPIIIQLTTLLAVALLAEASLSFLGLGVQPPGTSWGLMLAQAYDNIEFDPGLMYAPGFLILLTAVSFHSLGETLRMAMDPMNKRGD